MITREMSIIQVLQIEPKAAELLKSLGMSCSICMGSATETIEQGVRAHGLDLEKVLEKLNQLQEKTE
ncbi:MAG: DUF1858 domain-containing protein [Peptococcaceae bacterium]